MSNTRINMTIVWRGLTRRCPQCGQGRLFDGWWTVRECCDACELGLRIREPDTWFTMYMSMAFITGIFLAGMLWVFPMPANKRLSQAILVVAAGVLFVASEPTRKGVALALDYIMDLRWNNHGELRFREKAHRHEGT